jgi:hypothetical protein
MTTCGVAVIIGCSCSNFISAKSAFRCIVERLGLNEPTNAWKGFPRAKIYITRQKNVGNPVRQLRCARRRYIIKGWFTSQFCYHFTLPYSHQYYTKDWRWFTLCTNTSSKNILETDFEMTLFYLLYTPNQKTSLKCLVSRNLGYHDFWIRKLLDHDIR